jgi:hypothetical protein
MPFLCETSTAKPIESLLDLINLLALELVSQLDLPYQARGTSSIDLNERLGLQQHLPHEFDH